LAVKVSSFRERFTELVNESPKSRTQIAAEFGVAKQTISAWVTGQSSPRLPVITSLADYFDVSVNWLLGFDVPKVSDKEEYQKWSNYLDTMDYHPQTYEAAILARGIDQCSPEEREQALSVVQALFAKHADYFRKENDDGTEL